MDKSDLVIEERSSEDAVDIVVHDDVDLYSVPALRESLLTSAAKHRSGEFRVDLTRVGFIDSAGLALLLSLRKEENLAGRLIILVATSSHPERVLRLTRLDAFITVISQPPSTEAAA